MKKTSGYYFHYRLNLSITNSVDCPNISTSRKLLQLRVIAIKHIRVTTIGIIIIVLPDRIIWPISLRRARRGIITRHHQRICVDKDIRIARALLPPRRAGIQHRIPRGSRLIRIAELLNPLHTNAIALKIQHAWQRNAIAAPIAAVLDEVVDLRSSAHSAISVVISAANEAGVGGAFVLRAEVWVGVVGALRGFDVNEAQTVVVGLLEVDVGLVAGDVEALHCAAVLASFEVGVGCDAGDEGRCDCGCGSHGGDVVRTGRLRGLTGS